MSGDSTLSRRQFARVCASALALVGVNPGLLAQTGGVLKRYHRVPLLDVHGRPLKPTDVKVGEEYIFYYPYVATPCFLLNLGTPTATQAELRTEDGKRYSWNGGAGPERSIVAFSAICAHRMSHPARDVSFINYRHAPTTFKRDDGVQAKQARVIYCCSENSVYDPAQGGRVLGGPAKQPLAAIQLEQDGDGRLYAVGTVGGELFERFFREFSSRLALELRTSDLRQLVAEKASVMPLAEYCRNQVLC
jgi:Rieske Fe-S protein